MNNLEVVRKHVRPISKQEENESRLLWKEVTAGLKFNNIDNATTAKASIEQNQRDLVKQRQEENQQWQTKLFKQDGDGWTYIKPLQ